MPGLKGAGIFDWWFGSVSPIDGDVTASSGTLTRNMFYNNLTVPNGVTITTNGYLITVKNTLTIAAGGQIRPTPPQNGGDAIELPMDGSPYNPGTAPNGGSGSDVSGNWCNGGGDGGNDYTGDHGQGMGPGLTGNPGANGSYGGAGGNGGTSTTAGGAGGTVDPGLGTQSYGNIWVPNLHTFGLRQGPAGTLGVVGGAGGGSGGRYGSGGGEDNATSGGGGGGGGVIAIAARTIVIADSVNATKPLYCPGGAGGNGYVVVFGHSEGGGGGGGGGAILLAYGTLTITSGGALDYNVLCPGGAGGNCTPFTAQNGVAGSSGKIYLFPL